MRKRPAFAGLFITVSLKRLFQRCAKITSPDSGIYEKPNAKSAKCYELEYTKAELAFVEAVCTDNADHLAKHHAE